MDRLLPLSFSRFFEGATFLLLCLVAIGCAPTGVPKRLNSDSSWENSLVKEPGDTPEAGKIYVVRGGRKHWISHSSWISAHSVEFPKGVQIITVPELEAIPAGDAITDEK